MKSGEYGGKLYSGKRKSARPIAVNKNLLVEFKSSKARGAKSLTHPRNRLVVNTVVREQATRFKISVDGVSNEGKSLQIVIRGKRRASYQGFLRCVPGIIARRVTGAQKGREKGKFWDGIAYSKVLE